MHCEICNWGKGRYLHHHHIIPLSELGEDCKENIIMLCPNCHAEAHKIGIEIFNAQHHLIGKKIDALKLKAMQTYIKIFLEHCFPSEENPKLTSLTNVEQTIADYLSLRFKFTHIEAMSLHLGVTPKNLMSSLTDTTMEDINNGKIPKNKLDSVAVFEETEKFKRNADKILKELLEKNENYKIVHRMFENLNKSKHIT